MTGEWKLIGGKLVLVWKSSEVALYNPFDTYRQGN